MKYSVVIPVYNAEKYILKALECLKEQTYKGVEIIVVNDGSTDKSEELILGFKKSNPSIDIKYQRNENSGPSKARNTGIDLATGDYICFLDADDYYDVHLFEEIEKVISRDIDILYFGFNEYDEQGKQLMTFTDDFKYFPKSTGMEIAKKKYLKETWLNNCNEIYRLDLIKKNNIRYLEGVYLGEDANFIYKCLLNAKVVECLPKELFYHICNDKSLFRNEFSMKNVTEFKAIENTLDYIKEHDYLEFYDYIYSLYYHTRVTVAKKMIESLRWHQGFKFKKMVKSYIPKVKKPKELYFNKKQKFETRLYIFSKLMFFCFVKMYQSIKK